MVFVSSHSASAADAPRPVRAKRPRLRVAFAGAAAAALAACGLAATPATAAPGRTCVADPGGQRCFGNFREAVAFATHGAITDAPLDAHTAALDPAFRSRMRNLAATTLRTPAGNGVAKNAATQPALQGGQVIGAAFFSGTNYTGDSYLVPIDKPCVKDGWYDYYVTLNSWAHRIESVQAWANCWVWLHEGDSWDSARQGPYKSDTPDLGDWKDRAVLVGLS